MSRPLVVGGLFSGIGGWELGLERAGMEIAWHCEADPFCRRVLEKHWPGVPTFEDVCTLNAGMAEGVDVLCGGFPCQGLSDAGLKLGLLDPRSGLWSEYARLIGEFRPRYVLVENVSALLGRGLDRVLGDLSALGYDAEWDCVPASAFGAPHRRDRIWIVAYPHDPHGQRDGCSERDATTQHGSRIDGASQHVADADCEQHKGSSHAVGWTGSAELRRAWAVEPDVGRVADGVPAELDFIGGLIGEQGDYSQADTATRRAVWEFVRAVWEHRRLAATSPDVYRNRLHRLVPALPRERAHQGWFLGARLEEDEALCDLWRRVCAESFEEAQDMLPELLVRVGAKKRPQALGTRQERLRSLGNALVPQIAEWIGRRVLAYEMGMERL